MITCSSSTKMLLLGLLVLTLVVYTNRSVAANTADEKPVTIAENELRNFAENQTDVKKLLRLALALAGQNLGYKYGSSDPKNRGMDCSGTIYYLLHSIGITDAPRSSHTIYQWAWTKGNFHAVNSTKIDSFEFQYLRPGDLLFWNGTYNVAHDPNVTHVMIYLGKDKDNRPLMIGASNGRSYKGQKIYGVSVFDFKLPSRTSKSRFLGYSCTPQLNCDHR